ncbi:GDYXXLXY domain-containing protein [Pelagibius sp. Alg239-R121]|uniref:GDYXXLXY domain-containing protein n=1 Tax=Pelagibius sp. Alg239-R121 TaxID=2993448 RepID=UPI0024A69FDF|nr:GDYXXLXY domain-containing protein [Pelagibius sp. Alg239-R121]
MRSRIMIALALAIFAVLNFGIYEKQKIIESGEIVLLELAPVDPRSLMQGDYMSLRYAIERSDAVTEQREAQRKRGYMVIKPDEKNVAQFVRFHAGEDLKAGERLLRFHKTHETFGSVYIVPDSFLFQEGHAKHYEAAKYGVFKFDGDDNRLLVGLATEDGKMIVVTEPEL